MCAVSECSRLRGQAKLSATSSSKPFSSVVEFIEADSYFMFAWPLYYGRRWIGDEVSSEKVDGLLRRWAAEEMGGEAVVRLEEACESMEVSELVADVHKLAQRFSRAEAAKGNWLFDGAVSGFVVSDPGWFMGLIDTLALGESKLTDCEEMRQIVGKSRRCYSYRPISKSLTIRLKLFEDCVLCRNRLFKFCFDCTAHKIIAPF